MRSFLLGFASGLVVAFVFLGGKSGEGRLECRKELEWFTAQLEEFNARTETRCGKLRVEDQRACLRFLAQKR